MVEILITLLVASIWCNIELYREYKRLSSKSDSILSNLSNRATNAQKAKTRLVEKDGYSILHAGDVEDWSKVIPNENTKPKSKVKKRNSNNKSKIDFEIIQ